MCKMSSKVYAIAHLMNAYNFVYLTGNVEGTIFPGQVLPENFKEKKSCRVHIYENLRQQTKDAADKADGNQRRLEPSS